MSSKVNDAAPLKRPLERWRSSMFVGAMSCSLKAFLNKASVFRSKGKALTLTTRDAWRRAVCSGVAAAARRDTVRSIDAFRARRCARWLLLMDGDASAAPRLGN